MCIRDRRCTAAVYLLFPASVLVWQNDHFELWTILPDRHDPCLLYTSDAADERSSVDLGGRRIIKKKKITVRER